MESKRNQIKCFKIPYYDMRKLKFQLIHALNREQAINILLDRINVTRSAIQEKYIKSI